MTVSLLKTCRGIVVSVWESADEAQAKADKYNADPFVEPGVPDEDAPYTVETWALTRANARAAS